MPPKPSAPNGPGASFDALAGAFDRRRGLPPGIGREVARAVLSLVPAKAGSGCLLELGAGTGEIGRHLAAGPVRYLGLDRSLGMLRRFLHRLPAGPAGHLLVADLDYPWPLTASTVGLIFASRTLHRLSPDNSVHELRRTARPGARLLLGRIRRPAESPGARLRHRLRELVAEAGFPGRDAGGNQKALVQRLADRGARRKPSRIAARWRSEETPAATLAKWREKVRLEIPELAGTQVPRRQAVSILEQVEGWARGCWGDLDVPHSVEAAYELTVVDLDP